MTNEVLKKEKIAEKPKIIIKYEPSPTFEDEFLEFVEEVLSWPEPEEERKQ